MRIRELVNILSENIGDVKVEINEDLQAVIFLKGIKTFWKYISNIKKLGLFSEMLEKIEATESFARLSKGKLTEWEIDKDAIKSPDFKSFYSLITAFKETISSFVDSLEKALPPQNEDSISIKLPKISSLTDLAKFMNKLGLILEQCLVNEEIKGKVEIQNFDSGSLWIDISVGHTLAVKLIGGLAWSAAVIRKKIIEMETIKKQIESLEIKNESLQDVVSAQKKQVDTFILSEIQQLFVELKLNSGNDKYMGDLVNSIKSLGELINKGAEIYHSLSASEDIKKMFPDYKQLENLKPRSKTAQEPSVNEPKAK